MIAYGRITNAIKIIQSSIEKEQKKYFTILIPIDNMVLLPF